MRPCFVRSAAPLLLALLAGCRDTAAPRRVHAVTLSSRASTLWAPQLFQLPGPFDLRVDADPGVSTDVRWSSSDTAAFYFAPSGEVRLCAAAPSVVITATSLSDTTKRASVTLTVNRQLAGVSSITSIVDAATQAPVAVNALRGEVRIGVALADLPFTCTGLARFELVAVAAGGAEYPVVVQDFTPPRRDVLQQRYVWNTGTVPNGAYTLEIRGYLAGRTSPDVHDLRSVDVRN